MKTPPRTALWAGVLLASAALVAWQALHDEDGHTADDGHGHEAAAVQRVIPLPEAQWSAVDVVTPQRRQRFERDAQGLWLAHRAVPGEAAVHGHAADAADLAAAPAIAAVMQTFSRARIERSLPGSVPGAAAAAGYGLERPATVILVFGRDGRSVLALEAGDLAPDGLGRYVHLNRGGPVHIVPNYQVEQFLKLQP